MADCVVDGMAEDQDKRNISDPGQDASSVTASAENADAASLLPTCAELGFTGTYTHGLDAKGRLIVPASFRDGLGARFAVCPSPDFKTIALYPLKAWLTRRNEYVSLCAKDATMRRILDHFTKYSYVDSEMDAQGRLLLPGTLRGKMLGDAREVDVNGSYDHIVIEDSGAGRLEDERFEEDFPDVLGVIAAVQKA